MKTDFLVIGSGIAGLAYAIKMADNFPNKKIVVITKEEKNDTNTYYAQGGVALVQNSADSLEKHVQDTLRSGDGLCDEKVVRMVISEGAKCLRQLIQWGVTFDSDDEGTFDLAKEGGHSESRIMHHKDVIGKELTKVLNSKLSRLRNVDVFTHHFAIDLIIHSYKEGKKSKRKCMGAYVLDESGGNVITLLSKITLLATGGLGQVYKHTTNPKVATGDGIAMAYRASACIKEIEFIQFHPTALCAMEKSTLFLISEAVRGFGAKLKTMKGKHFMHKYDHREELASRDIVARAIEFELKKSKDTHVYLDCTHLDAKEFSTHFPTITERCHSIGVNVQTDYIPVVPSVHYVCGGVEVNQNGETAINHLFACGECSRTGLHGANRLASNSLLEAIVFADRCAETSTQEINSIVHSTTTELRNYKRRDSAVAEEKTRFSDYACEIQTIMQNHAGIIRSNEGLRMARRRLKLLYSEIEKLFNTMPISRQLCELRNRITVAYLIVVHSQKRKENRGGFYNLDLS